MNRAIHSVIADYNKEETANARKEKREALLLPNISAHHLRHRKLRDLSEAAGAVYRINDVHVLINREILDEFLEQFRQPARTDVKI